jgi:plastocyanin
MPAIQALPTLLSRATARVALCALGLAAIAGAARAQTGGDPNPPADCAGVANKVEINPLAFTFVPAEVTVQPGEKVCWTWSGSHPHNVQADNGSFDSGSPASSGLFQVTFDTPGSYGYYCFVPGGPGGGMRGRVIVAGGTPPAAPTAPTELRAAGISPSAVRLTWRDTSTSEQSFRIERQDPGGGFVEIASVGAGVQTFDDTGLQPDTVHLYRLRARNAGGNSAYTDVDAGATDGPAVACVPSATTLCLGGTRFTVQAKFRHDGGNGDALAVPVPSAPDSGLFTFFGASNLELLVKALDACVDPYDRYWVFLAATTNVEVMVTVRDTSNGRTWAWFNPLGRPAPPVQDTEAFDTCP